jgi:hypothetical protein
MKGNAILDKFLLKKHCATCKFDISQINKPALTPILASAFGASSNPLSAASTSGYLEDA